ncbi:MAG: hypothetical protein P8182_02760 [Deltaproteobacteria bacterium]
MSGKFGRKEFLEVLFEDYFENHDGFVMVKIIRRLDRRVSTRYFPGIEVLERQQYGEDENVFFGVGPRETMQPGPKHIKYLTALWAGMDFGPEGHSGRASYFKVLPLAALAIRRFPLPPSVIVESGWGVHLYWLLKKPMKVTNVARVERVLRSLNNYFHCQGGSSIGSTLRLPDTTNCKMPSESTDCKLKYINDRFRYGIEEFEKLDKRFLEPSRTSQAIQTIRTTTLIDAPPVDDVFASNEPMTAVLEQSVDVLDEFSTDELADLVAERVFKRLRNELVDEIVNKLIERLSNPQGP